MKTIDLDPTLRTDPRFGRQRFSAKAAYIEMYMYAASTENWGMFSSTIEDIAWILGRGNEIDLMQRDIDALVGAGLLIAHPDGSIEIAGFREIQQRIIGNRDYYKRLQASRRAKTEQPLPSGTEPDNDNNNVSNIDVTCNNNVSNVSVDCITKPNQTKPNVAAGKKNDQPKNEPAAAEPESIKLWRDWTLHTGKIAPSFFERLTTEVKDIDVWKDTLAFGAKNRKIAHTNAGLDWALTNYKTGIAQKRANALTKNQSNGSNVVGKYADKLVKTEIDGVEVYYG